MPPSRPETVRRSSPHMDRETKPEALGQSDAFLAFQESLSRVARVERPVLLIGERGTGKELAAERLHYLSERWQSPLVALNCAALSPTLIESELFGYEQGAFTGAAKRKTGRFEAAHSGTLFLDEIANIPMEVQEKILRAVEYGSFERVGSSHPIRVDVRILGATNADLPTLVEEGRFMRDLLDRLSFEVIYLPPLRDRKDDILLLANHFAARMARELERPGVPEFSEEARELLCRYPWPGNVRELKNVVERAVYRADGDAIRQIVFDPFRSPYRQVSTAAEPKEPESIQKPAPALPAEPLGQPEQNVPFTEAVRNLELSLIRNALEEAKYNQKEAADLLGLTYHQFRGLYRKYSEEFKG